MVVVVENASLPSATCLRSFEGITLRTERLKLRAFESSDAEAILALFSDHGFTKEGHFREHCICSGVVSDSVFTRCSSVISNRA